MLFNNFAICKLLILSILQSCQKIATQGRRRANIKRYVYFDCSGEILLDQRDYTISWVEAHKTFKL